MRILALALLLQASAFARPAAGADHPLTLDEAIHRALEKNEDLVIEREAYSAAGASLGGARGAYDPLVQLDGAWSRSNQPLGSFLYGLSPNLIAPEVKSTEAGLSIQQLLPTGGGLSLRARGARETTGGGVSLLSPAYSTQVGVELRQPLLRDRATDAARRTVRVARADRGGAAASLRRAVSETVAAVERAYWGLVDARLEVGVREEAVRLAEEQLSDTQERVQNGSAPQTELAQPRAELERRRGELLGSRETLARAENDLKLLILDGAGDALWADPLVPVEDAAMEVTPVDVAAALQRALSARPELAQSDAVVNRRRAEAAFARDGVLPNLDAVVSYDRFGLAGSSSAGGSASGLPPGLEGDLGDSFESLGDGDYDAARFALVLGFPIGNRAARGEAAVAAHVERQAEADRARVRKAIRAEVLDAAAALDAAGQRIAAARSGREAAEIQLSAEKERYATGLSTNFLVLTRQNDLSRARLDEISALTDYRTARAEMSRATGSLIEEHGIQVGDTPQKGGSK